MTFEAAKQAVFDTMNDAYSNSVINTLLDVPALSFDDKGLIYIIYYFCILWQFYNIFLKVKNGSDAVLMEGVKTAIRIIIVLAMVGGINPRKVVGLNSFGRSLSPDYADTRGATPLLHRDIFNWVKQYTRQIAKLSFDDAKDQSVELRAEADKRARLRKYAYDYCSDQNEAKQKSCYEEYYCDKDEVDPDCYKKLEEKLGKKFSFDGCSSLEVGCYVTATQSIISRWVSASGIAYVLNFLVGLILTLLVILMVAMITLLSTVTFLLFTIICPFFIPSDTVPQIKTSFRALIGFAIIDFLIQFFEFVQFALMQAANDAIAAGMGKMFSSDVLLSKMAIIYPAALIQAIGIMIISGVLTIAMLRKLPSIANELLGLQFNSILNLGDHLLGTFAGIIAAGAAIATAGASIFGGTNLGKKLGVNKLFPPKNNIANDARNFAGGRGPSSGGPSDGGSGNDGSSSGGGSMHLLDEPADVGFNPGSAGGSSGASGADAAMGSMGAAMTLREIKNILQSGQKKNIGSLKPPTNKNYSQGGSTKEDGIDEIQGKMPLPAAAEADSMSEGSATDAMGVEAALAAPKDLGEGVSTRVPASDLFGDDMELDNTALASEEVSTQSDLSEEEAEAFDAEDLKAKQKAARRAEMKTRLGALGKSLLTAGRMVGSAGLMMLDKNKDDVATAQEMVTGDKFFGDKGFGSVKKNLSTAKNYRYSVSDADLATLEGYLDKKSNSQVDDLDGESVMSYYDLEDQIKKAKTDEKRKRLKSKQKKIGESLDENTQILLGLDEKKKLSKEELRTTLLNRLKDFDQNDVQDEALLNIAKSQGVNLEKEVMKSSTGIRVINKDINSGDHGMSQKQFNKIIKDIHEDKGDYDIEMVRNIVKKLRPKTD